MTDRTPLDIWLRFDSPDDEAATHEANTFYDDDLYRVEWYHVDVGQVTTETFVSYEDARAWLKAADYQDFSAGSPPTGATQSTDTQEV